MHHWSIYTYQSFCDVAEDFLYLSIELPRSSLQYDFMLHGILAVSALDIAVSAQDKSRSSKYALAAMEYYDKASTAFRKQLSDITKENVHCIFMASVMATSISVAFPRFLGVGEGDTNEGKPRDGELGRIVVFLRLAIVSSGFMAKYPAWMMGSPLGPSLMTAAMLVKEPSPALEKGTETALRQLGLALESPLPGRIAGVDQPDLAERSLRNVQIAKYLRWCKLFYSVFFCSSEPGMFS